MGVTWKLEGAGARKSTELRELSGLLGLFGKAEKIPCPLK